MEGGRMNKKLMIVLVLILIVIGVILVLPKEKQEEEEVEELNGKIALYFKGQDAMQLEKEYRNVSMKRIKNDMAKTIIEELLKGPTGENLQTTIPEGTTLRNVTTNGHQMIVDLSKEFEENQQGTAEDSLLAIYSIVNSLTEITEIEEVKFLIEGAERDYYKGYFEMNKPFLRSV